MKVLLISKAGSGGGAALAAYRLLLALRKKGVEAKMLVQDGGNKDEGIFSTTHGFLKRWINFLRFVLERLVFLPFEKSPALRFHFSLANTGEDLTRNPYFLEADIIHLHWINAGFLSLRSLQNILRSGKPVVWTFHDEWAYTGGCHLALDCRAFTSMCEMCPYLKKPGKHDLSTRIWNKKKRLFQDKAFGVITPSNWLHDRVRSSSLLGDFNIYVIPNLADTALFSPVDRMEASSRLGLDPEKRYILFGAASMTSAFKGFDYFREAVTLIHQKLGKGSRIEILLFGKSVGDVEKIFPLKTRHMGKVNSVKDMVDIYCMADVYVNPSLQESFGYTVLESMSCGTPVVGFRSGAISEIIHHKENGYLADYKSEVDLANGIIWSLNDSDPEEVSERARRSILDKFREEDSAAAHIAIYQSILEENGTHE
jgi:glycosyltransferase involved in cell wall biosynthesis